MEQALDVASPGNASSSDTSTSSLSFLQREHLAHGRTLALLLRWCSMLSVRVERLEAQATLSRAFHAWKMVRP